MVLVSSCLARFGVPGYTAYCASKAALLGLTRALSLELAPQILVNAICPGWVDTQMARDGIHGMAQAMGLSYEDAHAQAMSLVPMGRMSKPEEIGWFGGLAVFKGFDGHDWAGIGHEWWLLDGIMENVING